MTNSMSCVNIDSREICMYLCGMNDLNAEAKFITRSAGQWYSEPLSTDDESISFEKHVE